MKIQERNLKGIFEIVSSPLSDDLGDLTPLFHDKDFLDAGLNTKRVQESLSHINKKYTLKGLRVSLAPALECKTVTAIRGKVLWVVVDIRKGSESFGQWDSIVLSGELHNTLYVQSGFAYGCLSLTDDCDFLLRADNYFSVEHGTGIVWNDKELGIDWGVDDTTSIIISERDERLPTFKEFKEKYGGT